MATSKRRTKQQLALSSRISESESTEAHHPADVSGNENAQETIEPALVAQQTQSFSDPRLAIRETICGTDFDSPGGERLVIELIQPLNLTAESRVLVVGAGLGGSTRAIARHTGAMVIGIEENNELADAAMERSIFLGMSDQARVRSLDLADINMLAPESFDAIFSMDHFFRYPNKTPIFAYLYRALKDSGGLVWTDYVINSANSDDKAVRDWLALEPEGSWPWTVDWLESSLELLNFNVPMFRDITQEYVSLARSMIQNYSKNLKVGPMDKNMAQAVFNELDLWNRRIEALRSGALDIKWIYVEKQEESEAP